MLGRPVDRAKCRTRFDRTVALLDAKAALADFRCRYRDDADDNTVTDFKTGLMWVKLAPRDGAASDDILDVDNVYDWYTAATGRRPHTTRRTCGGWTSRTRRRSG